MDSEGNFAMIDVKMVMDPETINPRKKIRAKDTHGLADLIASQGKSAMNLDSAYAKFMEGSSDRGYNKVTKKSAHLEVLLFLKLFLND